MATAAQTAVQEAKQFIGGELDRRAGGATFDDRDPFTGDVVAHVPAGGAEDARRAIEAAQRGVSRPGRRRRRPSGRRLPQGRRHPREPPRRGRLAAGPRDRLQLRLRHVPDGLRARPLPPGGGASRYAPIGHVIPSDIPGAFAMGIRKPVGVVGAIAPWNAALILSARSIAAPLALGNTVVLKPSEESPYVGRPALGRDLRRGGAAGRRAEHRHARARRGGRDRRRAGREPRRAPDQLHRLDARGRRLAEAAGRHLKRVVLELGGYNPLIVLADADLDYAVERDGVRRLPAPGPDLHVGAQDHRRAGDRRGVHRAARREDAGLKAGDPKEHDTIIGPLINADALATVKGRVDEAVAKGARVLAGGEAVGPCYQATLITDVPADSRLRAARDLRARGWRSRSSTAPTRRSSAANDTTYGLSAGILTSDADRGLALAQQLESGIVHVNDQPVGDEPQMPFGGVKDSGWGRFGGQAVVDEFTELRWITVQSGTHPFPF